MNVLILYSGYEKQPRKTISDSLYCFMRYDKMNRYYYLNVFDPISVEEIAKEIDELNKISVLIIHYSGIAMRYDPVWWNRNYPNILRLIKKMNCLKIIIPQDDYNHTIDIQRMISDAHIDIIYTIAAPRDYDKLYPKSLGYTKIETVYTGYVDENTLHMIQKDNENEKREFDIGYRARALPFWVGRHGQLKIELAKRFLKYLKSHETNLRYDIMNTTSSGVFYGDSWIEFLLRCRTTLGCLGGTGLIDFDGSIRIKVDQYMKEHPNASFDECEEHCFQGKDNVAHVICLTPRLFECAMTKTCQLLVEGDYDGVFLPGRDYIEIKKDFSNIAEVLEKVKDKEYCKKIANQCYEDVVESGKYTYKTFVNKVINYDDIQYDKGNDYLLNVDKICKISHLEGINDRGLFDYKIIRAGGARILKRWGTRKYFSFRMRGIYWSLREIYIHKLQENLDKFYSLLV